MLSDTPSGPHRDADWFKKAVEEKYQLDLRLAKMLAGADYAALTSSVDTALSYTQHAKPQVRLAALLMCQRYWKCAQEERFRQRCMSLVKSDSVEDCRLAAIRAIALAFSKTDSFQIQEVLAAVVKDSTNSSRIRNTAYCAMRVLLNGLADGFLDLSDDENQPLADIDWSWMSRFDRGN